jgi:hypothetical protein
MGFQAYQLVRLFMPSMLHMVHSQVKEVCPLTRTLKRHIKVIKDVTTDNSLKFGLTLCDHFQPTSNCTDPLSCHLLRSF